MKLRPLLSLSLSQVAALRESEREYGRLGDADGNATCVDGVFDAVLAASGVCSLGAGAALPPARDDDDGDGGGGGGARAVDDAALECRGPVVNCYDYRLYSNDPGGADWPEHQPTMTAYMRDARVLRAVHAEAAPAPFEECSETAGRFLARDTRGVAAELEDVLENAPQVRVLVYAGQFDVICNHVGVEDALDGASRETLRAHARASRSPRSLRVRGMYDSPSRALSLFDQGSAGRAAKRSAARAAACSRSRPRRPSPSATASEREGVAAALPGT